MTAITVHSDLGAQEEEICHYFHIFPFYLPCSKGARCHDLVFFFLIFSLKPALSLTSFTLIKRLFSYSLLSAIKEVSSTCLRLMFLPPILIPACNSSSLAFLMMCSAYRLNNQGDSREPCHTPFSILSQSVVLYRSLTVAPWHTYSKFLRRQVNWSGLPISPRAFHSLSWSTQSKALA